MPQKQQKIWEPQMQFTKSKLRKMSDEDVISGSLLAELVRRALLWPTAVLPIIKNTERGCIFLPYDLISTATMCSVFIVRLQGSVVLPNAELLRNASGPNSASVAWFARRYVTAPKTYYRTPEAMVADGWRYLPF